MRIVVSIVRPFVSVCYKRLNILIYIVFFNTHNPKNVYQSLTIITLKHRFSLSKYLRSPE